MTAAHCMPMVLLTDIHTDIRSDETEKVWVWRTGDEGEAEFWFDHGTIVHARVEKEKWEDAARQAPTKADKSDKKIPYSIEVSQVYMTDVWSAKLRFSGINGRAGSWRQ